MRASKTAKALKQMVSTLGRPPMPNEMFGNLRAAVEPASPPDVETSVQLNLRVPAHVKQRVRMLAARDGITNSELVARAVALYEKTRPRTGRE